jgi:hypothetical protein
MGRVVAVLAGWTLAIAMGVFFVPSRVQMCLGPLNVTPESCRAAMGLPPETDWDRFIAGPGPILLVALIGYVAIGAWAVRRKRQRGGL